MANSNLNPSSPQLLDPVIVDKDPQTQLELSSDEPSSPEPVSLADPNTSSNLPSTELAAKRTKRIDFGLGNTLQKSPVDIYQQVSSGQEDILRQAAASHLNYKNAMKKQELIQELALKQKGPITPEQMYSILNSGEDISPDDVVERAYAKKFINTSTDADSSLGGATLSQAQKEIPQQIDPLVEKSSNFSAKVEIARKVSEDINNELETQGWVPFIADTAKQFFQPYSEIKMRGLNPNVGITEGLVLGDNLQRQADDLFMNSTVGEFRTKLTDITNKLRQDNPQLAQQFMGYVLGKSTMDRYMDNTFSALAPLDVQAVGSGILGLGRKVSVWNRTNKAFKDIAEAAAKETDLPAKAVATEAAGDVKSAAATRFSENVESKTNGSFDPVKDIKENLTSNFNLDRDFHDTNPGNLSREQLTRLKNSYDETGSTLKDTLENSLKVNRTLVPLENEEAIRAYQEGVIKRQFPGTPSNQIGDISSPRWDPVTSTNHFDVPLYDVDGTLFQSPEQAANFAKMKGIAEPKIVEATGPIVSEPKKYVGKARDLERRRQLSDQLSRLPDDIQNVKVKLKDKTLPKEAKAKLREDLKFFQKTQKEYTKQLAQITERVKEIPAKIEQNGFGYKIVVTKPYRETEDITRNFLLASPDAKSTSSATGFKSWKNTALGWIRGADDTLSLNESMQRKAATYAQNNLHKWARDKAASIEAVATGKIPIDLVTGEKLPVYKRVPRYFTSKFSGNQMFKEFNQTLDFARPGGAINPETGKADGYFFRTVGELEDHYRRFFDRSPTYPEIEAYFAHVQLTEADRILREIAEYRNRARLGTEQHQFRLVTPDGKSSVETGFFDGVQRFHLPGGEYQIAVFGKKQGEETLHYTSHIETTLRKELENNIATGKGRLVEIYDPDSHPLKGISDIAGNERIRYVYTESGESKPLEFNHVNRRYGGHVDYDYSHYIKQARISAQSGGASGSDKRSLFRHVYIGDTTLMGMNNRAIARDVIKHLEEVRKFLKDGKADLAEAYAREHLPMKWDEVDGWFKPGKDKEGKPTLPRLSVDEPFYLVPKNKKIYDLDKSLESRYKKTFQDGTKSGSLAQQYQVAYNVERDAEGLKTIEDVGSVGNPVYNYVDAKMVDPIPTMNRALQRAINSTFMDDYKISAVEHWLEEAKPHLKAFEDEVRAAPFWHFNNPDFKSGTDINVKSNLMSNREKIRSFLGKPNTFDTWIDSASQSLAEAFYRSFGPEESRSMFGKAITLTPTYLLSRVHDPIQFLRSFAFHAKLGLFNIPQLLVQAQSHATIWAIEPKHGTAGTWASFLHQASRANSNPAILDKLDELASKLNGFGSKFRPGEWKEAREAMLRSGFDKVAGEFALRDDQLKSTFIKNDWKNFLEAGQIFFKEGEKSVRLTAWYTAFREFRELHPTGKLTNTDLQKILNKADLLTTNMSRASASMLHQGIFGLSTQFLTYQLRSAELFLGTRLGNTTAERAMARFRLLTVYSAIYGIPMGVGITGAPVGDFLRQYAIDNGVPFFGGGKPYVAQEKLAESLLMEGVPSIAMAFATGKGDWQKGNLYNVGERLGVQGFTQLRDALFSDQPFLKIVGGAGGNVGYNTWLKMVHPFFNAYQSFVSPVNKGNLYPLTSSDFLDVFKEISSFTAARRTLWAVNYGKWMNSNEQSVSDTSISNAVFMALTGLSPQGQNDVFAKGNIAKEEQNAQKEAQKEIILNYHRALRALADGDKENHLTYMKRAKVLMEINNIPLDMRNKIIAQGNKGMEDLIKKSDWNFGTSKNIPANKQENRLDQYKRQLKINENKGQ